MPGVRTNTEHVSLLPHFNVKRSEDYPDWFLVTCPREDCGHTFLVESKQWRKFRTYKDSKGIEHTITGKPCPYCSRAGRVPSGRRGGRV